VANYPAARPFVASAGGLILGGRSLRRGYSVRETAGNAAVVRLWDNSRSASGLVVWSQNLAANGSLDKAPGFGGIVFEQGVFAEIVSGAVEWIEYLSPETTIDTTLAVFDDYPTDIGRGNYDALVELEGT
jgi:hypothetical protein